MWVVLRPPVCLSHLIIFYCINHFALYRQGILTKFISANNFEKLSLFQFCFLFVAKLLSETLILLCALLNTKLGILIITILIQTWYYYLNRVIYNLFYKTQSWAKVLILTIRSNNSSSTYHWGILFTICTFVPSTDPVITAFRRRVHSEGRYTQTRQLSQRPHTFPTGCSNWKLT